LNKAQYSSIQTLPTVFT